MATLREWFDGFTERTGEKIETIVFGASEWDDRFDEWGLPETGRVVAIDHVEAAVLDHEFSDGYGGNESPNFAAWSPSFVVFSDNYDGAEGIVWVPRNPTDHQPVRPGGG